MAAYNLVRRLTKLEAERGGKITMPIIVYGDEPEPMNSDRRQIIRIDWLTRAEADGRCGA
jgi:hypothetical protein